MVGFYNYTVIATYISMCIGVAGAAFAAMGNFNAAIICLVICGGLDMVDGKIASTRKRNAAEKRFGIQIDSLSDLIAFGALPAAIGFQLCGYAWWCFILFPLYVLGGLVRLAYYNVTEEQRQDKGEGSRKYYLGLPITCAALILPIVWALTAFLSMDVMRIVFPVMMGVIGLGFITPVRLPKVHVVGMIVMGLIGLAAGVIDVLLLCGVI